MYAVCEDQLQQQQQTTPGRRRRRDNNDEGDLEATVKSIKSDLNSVKDKLCTVAKDTAVPIGLKITLEETFKCKICMTSPMIPSIQKDARHCT